jgi:hypothetical protein
MNLSRRQSLGLLAGAVITPTVVVGAAPIVAAATKMTPQERYDYHLEQLKMAAQDLDPMIGHWHVSGIDNDGMGCALIVTAFRVIGRYHGDGAYESASSRWDGARIKYDVRLMDQRVDGERLFRVSNSMDRMQLLESRLNTFIGRKLGALA